MVCQEDVCLFKKILITFIKNPYHIYKKILITFIKNPYHIYKKLVITFIVKSI